MCGVPESPNVIKLRSQKYDRNIMNKKDEIIRSLSEYLNDDSKKNCSAGKGMHLQESGNWASAG